MIILLNIEVEPSTYCAERKEKRHHNFAVEERSKEKRKKKKNVPHNHARRLPGLRHADRPRRDQAGHLLPGLVARVRRPTGLGIGRVAARAAPREAIPADGGLRRMFDHRRRRGGRGGR